MTQNRHQTGATHYRVNWVLLAVTLVTCLVLAAGLYFWRGYQLGQIASTFKVRAAALREEARWQPAADYLYRYVSLRPEDVEARVSLAEVYDQSREKQGPNPRSVELYYQALAVAPQPDQARLRGRAIELLSQLGRFVESEKEAQNLLDADPTNAEALRHLALSVYRQYQVGALGARDQRIAVETAEAPWYRTCTLGEALQRAVAANPADVALSASYARLLRDEVNLLSDAQRKQMPTREQREAAADAAMQALLTAAPDQPLAYLERYVYRTRYDQAGAEDDLEAALQRGPDDPIVVRFAARHFLQKATEARKSRQPELQVTILLERSRAYHEKWLEKFQELNPQGLDLLALMGLSDVLVLSGDIDGAIKTLETASQKLETPNEELLLRLAELLIRAERYDDAQAFLVQLEEAAKHRDVTQVTQRMAPLDQARMLLTAALRLQAGEPFRSIALLRPLTVTGDAQLNIPQRASVLLGSAYSSLGQWDQAAEAYQQAARLDPESLSNTVLAATAWMNAGQPAKAVPLLRQAATRTGQRSVRFNLALAILGQLRSTTDAQPGWTELETLLEGLRQPAAEGDDSLPDWRVSWLEAEFTRARSQAAGDPESIKQAEQQVAATLQKWETEQAGSDPTAWRELVMAYQRTDRPEDADRALARYRELSAKSADYYLLAAGLHAARGESDQVRQTLNQGLGEVTSDQQDRLHRAVAELDAAAGQYQPAREQMERILASKPGDVRMIQQLAELALQQDDPAAAEAWEVRLRDLQGDAGSDWRFLRARRLLKQIDAASGKTPTEHPQFAQIVQDEQALQAARPQWSSTHLLSARIAELRGNQQAAVAAYRRAVELGDRRAEVMGRLVELLNRQGRFDEAQGYLQQADSRLTESETLSVQAIVNALGRQDRTSALKLAEQRVQKSPEDAQAHAWHGRVLELNRQPVEAEKAYRQAVTLAPADVGLWNSLFAHYLGSGQTDKARTTLEEMATQGQLKPVELTLAKAIGLAALGDLREAEAGFQEAARLEPANLQTLKRLAAVQQRLDLSAAIATMEKIRGLDPQDDVVRRTLAAMLTRRAQGDDWKTALEILAGDAADGDNLDIRLRGLLLIQRSRSTELSADEQSRIAAELSTIQTRLEQQASLEDADRLLLIQLYERQRRVETDPRQQQAKLKAIRDQYRYLCARAKPELDHLFRLITFLIEQQDWTEADQRLAQLEGLAADNSRLLELRASALKSQGKSDEIPAVVSAFVERLEAKVDGDPQKSRLYLLAAATCTKAELYQEAEQWARRAADVNPAAYAVVAEALIAQGKSDDAAQLCLDRAREQKSAESASILASILVSGQPSPAIARESEPVLSEALLAHPTHLPLLFAVANLRFRQDKIAQSIALYEQLVALRPKDVLVLNNLATLLAEEPGREADALKYVDQALSISGRIAPLLDTKASALMVTGRVNEAVPLLREITASPTADPRYFLHLAIALHETGQTAAARDALQQAKQNRLSSSLLTARDLQQLAELERKLAAN